MKNLLIILTLVTFASACKQKSATGSYGKTITEDGAITAADLVAQMGEKTEMAAKVKGTIVSVCKSEGCWYTIAINDGTQMTINAKDHKFFLPKDCEGKTAIAEGTAKAETISVEKQKHLAEDAGKTPEEIAKITEPSKEITFEAEGVILQ